MVTVTIRGEQKQVQRGTTYESIVSEYQKEYDGTIAVVAANGKIRELFKKVNRDCRLDFFTLRDDVGHKTYVRTATMLFLKGIHDVFGAEAARKSCVEFTIGRGIYVNTFGEVPVSAKSAERIMDRMRELSDAKTPFMKHSYPIDDAVAIFREKGMEDKVKLFHYRMSSNVNVYEIDGYCDYYYGYMLPNAGYVKWYDVVPYKNGFMLVLPTKANPTLVEPFTESKKLFETMEGAKDWGRVAGIETVGDLNDQICSGSMSDLILVQEAEQERKIGEIAKDIVNRKNVKFVMIAGPSSSGKTTFSHRLSTQLRSCGLRPYAIATDNYFKNREDTPRDENGNYDFEGLGAMDVEQFNADMVRLLNGETVELPSFNFKKGQREYNGNFLTLKEGDVLVIEGIHCLNDQFTYALPQESKYKIYISCLTTLNIDDHNRIPTTDARLLRRIERDARTRGYSAQATIKMWPSVRRGEENNIFPFQDSADMIFNSSLIYETSLLKPYVQPLLFGVPRDSEEYIEAKRLLKFLNYFLPIPADDIPKTSLMREFIGGGCYHV